MSISFALPARRHFSLLALASLLLALLLPASPAWSQQLPDWRSEQWSGSWGAGPGGPPLDSATTVFNGQTVRLIVHTSSGGSRVRIRLSNEMGSSTLRVGGAHSADELIGGYRQLIARAHARGIAVYASTLTPFEGAVYYTAEKDLIRQAVNNWIRSANEFDAVVDFEQVLRDPANPRRLNPAYDSGDHLHPTNLGYQAMGNLVPLSLLGGSAVQAASPAEWVVTAE